MWCDGQRILHGCQLATGAASRAATGHRAPVADEYPPCIRHSHAARRAKCLSKPSNRS